MISLSLNDSAFLNIKNADYGCIISGISINEVINLIQNADLTEKKRDIIKYKNLLSLIKMVKEILTIGEIEIEKINFAAIKVSFY